MNPAGLVPTLEREDGTYLTQSPRHHRVARRDPSRAAAAARRPRWPAPGCARWPTCSRWRVHPLNNLRVLARLKDQFDADEEAQKAWFTHWATLTFDALETSLADHAATGPYCHGEAPGLADLCLYAQVWNNRRFDIGTDGVAHDRARLRRARRPARLRRRGPAQATRRDLIPTPDLTGEHAMDTLHDTTLAEDAPPQRHAARGYAGAARALCRLRA